jgi:hypothetical protein
MNGEQWLLAERIAGCARGLMYADGALRQEPTDARVRAAVLERLIAVRAQLDELIKEEQV